MPGWVIIESIWQQKQNYVMDSGFVWSRICNSSEGRGRAQHRSLLAYVQFHCDDIDETPPLACSSPLGNAVASAVNRIAYMGHVILAERAQNCNMKLVCCVANIVINGHNAVLSTYRCKITHN
jgi:hypothetical protein